MNITRRSLLLGTVSAVVLPSKLAVGQIRPSIHVVKGRGCACCTAWANLLSEQGFAVTSEELHPADLVKLKVQRGVPSNLASCHTAEIDGYIIEGHVPGEDIRRLISERPDAVGIAVAGMPYGSPGMGPESDREQYDVVLFRDDKSSELFSSYDSAG